MSDTPERYGSLSRWFHWGMAILIVWQFMKIGDLIDEGEHWVGRTLVPWHISIGLLIFILGIFYMIGKGYGLKVFGLQLVEKSETGIAWMASVGSLHAPVAVLFLLLVIGHICAAFYHHFILRDDTLKRMTR